MDIRRIIVETIEDLRKRSLHSGSIEKQAGTLIHRLSPPLLQKITSFLHFYTLLHWSVTSQLWNRFLHTTERVTMKCIECVYVQDVTGSLQDIIEEVKHFIAQFWPKLQTRFPRRAFRMAIVCFRDVSDDELIYIKPFSTRTETITKWIEEIEAYGGDDIYEALHTAMYRIVCNTDIKWSKNSERYCIVGTDAGPHSLSNSYHDDTNYNQEQDILRTMCKEDGNHRSLCDWMGLSHALLKEKIHVIGMHIQTTYLYPDSVRYLAVMSAVTKGLCFSLDKKNLEDGKFNENLLVLIEAFIRSKGGEKITKIPPIQCIDLQIPDNCSTELLARLAGVLPPIHNTQKRMNQQLRPLLARTRSEGGDGVDVPARPPKLTRQTSEGGTHHFLSATAETCEASPPPQLTRQTSEGGTLRYNFARAPEERLYSIDEEEEDDTEIELIPINTTLNYMTLLRERTI
jgi:hypothetical protein